MSSSSSGYDYSCSTYSPDGRIFQLEYALKAVENSGTGVGIRCSDGVVLGVEKPIISKLLVPGSNKKLFSVHRGAGIAVVGLNADGRQLVKTGREESSNFLDTFGQTIPSNVLASRVATVAHSFTLHGSSRPFGCTCLIASYDEDDRSCYLHVVDPSGTFFRYKACAAGRGGHAAKTELEKLDLTSMTCRQAVDHIIRIIDLVQDSSVRASKEKRYEIELSWICQESNWEHVHVPNLSSENASSSGVEEAKSMHIE